MGETKRHTFFGFQTEVDEAATRRWYAQAEPWGCRCGPCRNFLALARERRLPGFVLEPLDKLGIPPEKATYVCELYRQEGGHLYQFSCRVAGRILDGHGEPGAQGTCCHEIYPYGAPDFPEPHFDLEFGLTLPWTLKEPKDGPAT